MKTFINQNGNGVTKNVPDVQFYGDPDSFHLLCKASSQTEGWMKSTKAMEIPGVGCVVQSTTQQASGIDDSHVIAEALVFVPGVQIICVRNLTGVVTGRRLAAFPVEEGVELPQSTLWQAEEEK